MEYRFATEADLDLFADWNHQLIRDEGHRNQMTVPKLRQRMERWLASHYKAVIFLSNGEPVAYSLHRKSPQEVYLRQLFVRRDKRRKGLGHQIVTILRGTVWPLQKRINSVVGE